MAHGSEQWPGPVLARRPSFVCLPSPFPVVMLAVAAETQGREILICIMSRFSGRNEEMGNLKAATLDRRWIYRAMAALTPCSSTIMTAVVQVAASTHENARTNLRLPFVTVELP
jgi:hypothetical protein